MRSKKEQILATYAAFIHEVVVACDQPARRAELDPTLNALATQGYPQLASAIRAILGGRRDDALLAGLDEEDGTVIEAILRGLQNPASLPPLDQAADPTMAAPGLAGLIHDAARGDAQALGVLADMATQMTRAGGEMAQLAAILRRLINGERDAGELGRRLGAPGRGLLNSILEELGRLDSH
jgi:hypothetical protein